MPPAPIANPLRANDADADTAGVYVAIVPMASAVPGSAFAIASGFSARADPEIHRLSGVVLRLAFANFAINVLVRTVVLGASVARSNRRAAVHVVDWLFWCFVTYYVYWLGIQGVKTRNARCCGGCCCANSNCGYLTVFFAVYVFFASLHGIFLLFDIATGYWFRALVSFSFLALTASTAEYSRRLLDKLALLPRDDASADPGAGALPVADAREVDVQMASVTVAVADARDQSPGDGGAPPVLPPAADGDIEANRTAL